MAQYGEVRVDYITYTTGTSPSEANATVTVSSLVNNPNFSGNINVEGNGTIEGNLDVSGNADIHGDTILHGDLTVSGIIIGCLLYTSPSPRDRTRSRMPSSA